MKTIKAVSNQIATPIIETYCIRAKKVNNRPGYRPMLADFEYDSLQQYPDNIQLLYRDDYYNQYSDIFNVVEIITVNTILKEYFSAKAAYVNGYFEILIMEKFRNMVNPFIVYISCVFVVFWLDNF